MAYKVELIKEAIEILDELTDKQRGKVLRQINYLIEFGLTPANPGLRKIASSSLWELRILGKDNIRVLCIEIKKTLYILHLFFKKNQKTSARELKIALSRSRTRT